MITEENIFINAPEDEEKRQLYFIDIARQLYEEREKEVGRKLTFCVTTFGCQMNARDSEKLVGMLNAMNLEASESENSDVVIYNTCTVRENANNKVYGRLGILHNYKKKNKFMQIILCGCMMQESSVIEKLKESYSFVNLVFGTHNLYKFPELLVKTFFNKGITVDIWKDTDKIVENLPSLRKFSFKSGVNITYGCDNFCTYCIVPYVRGRERSRKPEDIVSEIKSLVADGVVEVMLLGQNVNSYGKGLEEKVNFANLLKMVSEIEGLKRVRFMTPHPKDLSDEVIDAVATLPKLCHHIHLPMQSGSTELLKKMNRHYTKEDYLTLTKKIRDRIPDCAITTDIIVGFPGETEEDFLDTMDVVEKVGFDQAFTFIYSKRTGTPAASYDNQIPEDVVKCRFDRLLSLVQEKAHERCEKLVNQNKEVLVEEINEQDSSLVTGKLENNMTVHFKGDSTMIGNIYNVRLNECKGFYYIGELVD